MKRPGFMLLELLVSTFIASMLAVVLFAAFAQTNRAVQTIDNLVDVSYKETLAINQLTKDISGAFIPTQGRKSKQTEDTTKKEAQAKTAVEQNKKEKKKRLAKFFYGTVKDERLNVLTCITNNSTLEYPLGVVRVVYRLVPEEHFNAKKPAYVLMRQESGAKLEFDDFSLEKKENGVRSYELIGNIKKLSVAYTAVINKQNPASKDSKEQSVEREYKLLNEWIMEDEQDKHYKDYAKIPYAVDIDIVLWDEHKEREKKVSFKIMLLNEVVEYEPEKPTQKPIQQPPSAKPAGMQNTTPKIGMQKTAQKNKTSALDQTFSALKTMLLAEGAVPPGGTT